MSSNLCPECGALIGTEQINLTEGVALCRECGKLSRLSDVAELTQPVRETLRTVPAGCAVSDRGDETVIRATLRSFGAMAGMLFFALFWNSIVSVFVLFTISGIYVNLIGPLPDWFPAPDGDNNMSLGMTLFLCVFLTPFVLVGAGSALAAVMTILGHVEVRIGFAEAQVRTGIGPLAWRRKFDPSQVRRVVMDRTAWESNGRAQPIILIESDRTVKFGSMLTDQRREWMRAVLQALLMSPDPRWLALVHCV